MQALEGGTGEISSARTSRFQAGPSSVNIVDPLDSAYATERGGGGVGGGGGVIRADNTIHLGSSAPGQGSAAPMDMATLQRTIQHLLRAELQSDSIQGAVTF